MKAYFFPNRPCGHKMDTILTRSGTEIVHDPRKADYYVWWKFTHHTEHLPDFAKDKYCVNAGCVNTLKDFVEERYRKFFKRNTFVDPYQYKGDLVRKSNLNGTHDGMIVTGPLEPEPGFVYQRYYDTFDGKYYIDVRIPVIFGKIPFIVLKYKSTPFGSGAISGLHHVALASTKIFPGEWIEKILRFCDGYLDYGEIDVMQGDIIDVNNTPSAAMFGYMTQAQKNYFIETVTKYYIRGVNEKIRRYKSHH